MAKFANLLRGSRARRTVPLPRPGAHTNAATGEVDGDAVAVDIRPLTMAEEAEVIGDAVAYAKSKGLEAPGPGDGLYDLAVQAHTIRLACLDTDVKDRAEPFFDSFDQIVASEDFTPDHIAYLYEHQVAFQEECSPRQRTMSTGDYLKTVARMAGGDVHAFLGMSHPTLWSCMRSMAVQLVSSLAANSASGAPSGASE